MPPSLELAHVYSSHAMALTLLGWYSRGLAYAKKSLDIRRSLGDLWGEGQSLSFSGCVLYAASRFAECIENCREAMRLLERTGDYWELHIAQLPGRRLPLPPGRPAGSRRGSPAHAQVRAATGRRARRGISLDIWSLATGGMVPEDILQARSRIANERDAQAKAQVLLAQGVQLTAVGAA